MLGLLRSHPVSSPLAEVASDVLTSVPGANVTLTCPGGGPEDNATVHWVLRSQMTGSHPGTPAGVGWRLLLPSVQPSDSGNYSCYREGHPAGRVRLVVDGEWHPQSAQHGSRVPGRDSPLDPLNSCHFLGQSISGKGPVTPASEAGRASSWVGVAG